MLVLLASIAAFAGTSATAADGRKVILNDDGTWVAAPQAEPVAVGSCAALISTTTDQVSGKTYTSLIEPVILTTDDKTGLRINLMQGSTGGVIWTTTAIGASGCLDDDNKANILFADGSRLEIENDADFNCDGRFTVYFGGSFGKMTQLAALASKDISVLRVWTRDGYVERNATPEQAATLRTAFACLKK